MTTYLLRRVLLLIPTLLGITLLTFFLIREAPGNAAMLKGGMSENGARALDATQRAEMAKLYGLDEPAPIAYYHWLTKILHLDLGESLVDHRSVAAKIGERLGLTLSLTGSALVLSYLLAVPLGIVAANHRGSRLDRGIGFGVLLLYSIPSFAAALLLLLFVAGGDYLNLLPLQGASSIEASEMNGPAWLGDRILHLILPVICLTYGNLAYISRYTRVSMLDVLGQDYLRTARAKGLPEGRVILGHAFRNALVPIVTLLALEVPALLAGSIIIETIFALPGMGQLAFQSLDAKDEPVIMGITLIAAIATLISYLVSDILYVAVDPRIRFS